MTTALVHDALIYDSDTEFVDWIGPFIRDGVERGDEVMVVTRPRNTALLRDTLEGTEGDVRFVDSTDWYRSPAQTIAEYQAAMDRVFTTGTSRLRVVGEVEFGPTEIDHAEWTRYESVLNTAFASRSAWIVCPYDTRRLPAHVVEDARVTHPNNIHRGSRHSSDSFDPVAHTTALPLPVNGRLLEELKVNGSLRPVRELVERVSEEAGLLRERAEEICLVVNEIATNAILHGQPPVRVRAWDDDPTILFEVTDTGSGPNDPLQGFIPPDPGQLDGKGLWLARQLADRLEIATSAEGTSVRIAASRQVALRRPRSTGDRL